MLRRLTLTLALLLCVALPALGGEFKLSWLASAGATGYRVHHGTTSGQYTANLDVGAVTTHDLALPDNVSQCLAVTAYNAAGASGFSNEICAWPAPVASTIDASCGPHPTTTGAVQCTATLDGLNYADDIDVDIPYPGVTMDLHLRESPTVIRMTFTIAADASGGNADLVLSNPNISGGGNVVRTFPGFVTVSPVVLPNPPVFTLE